jgi:hypothetical protein
MAETTAALWIWGSALCAYLLFRVLYDNWTGPLKPAEVEAIMAKLEARPSTEVSALAVVRQFLETDDGAEFFMVNLVKVKGGQAPHPETGVLMPGRALLQRYFRLFVRKLMARGGHPSFAARPTGGYVDAWNTPPDPKWSMFALMRYRSRRDLARIVVDPAFDDVHPFKIAGTEMTFAFPSKPVMQFMFGPRVWVGFVLAQIASLAHLAVLLSH